MGVFLFLLLAKPILLLKCKNKYMQWELLFIRKFPDRWNQSEKKKSSVESIFKSLFSHFRTSKCCFPLKAVSCPQITFPNHLHLDLKKDDFSHLGISSGPWAVVLWPPGAQALPVLWKGPCPLTPSSSSFPSLTEHRWVPQTRKVWVPFRLEEKSHGDNPVAGAQISMGIRDDCKSFTDSCVSSPLWSNCSKVRLEHLFF